MVGANPKLKGKGKDSSLIPPSPSIASASGSISESYSSDSGSSASVTSDSDDVSDEEISQEYLDSLLEKARQAIRQKALSENKEEDLIKLTEDDEEVHPQSASQPHLAKSSAENSEDGKRAAGAHSGSQEPGPSLVAPEPPVPPPELQKSGKALTKKERKAFKNQTAGPGWYDLPAPPESELPRLHREVEALRLRNQLDPKRFYRKEEGEGKGIKGLPKYFAIGTIVPDKKPFGGASGDDLPRSARKRTLVDELVDDAEARRYAKQKFNDLQGVRGAKGRGTRQARSLKKKPKW